MKKDMLRHHRNFKNQKLLRATMSTIWKIKQWYKIEWWRHRNITRAITKMKNPPTEKPRTRWLHCQFLQNFSIISSNSQTSYINSKTKKKHAKQNKNKTKPWTNILRNTDTKSSTLAHQIQWKIRNIYSEQVKFYHWYTWMVQHVQINKCDTSH